MVGQYAKQKYLKEGLKRKYDEDLDEYGLDKKVLQKPKFNVLTLGLTPQIMKEMEDDTKPKTTKQRTSYQPQQSTGSGNPVSDKLGTIEAINSGVGFATAVPGLVNKGLDFIGHGSETLTNLDKTLEGVGKVTNVAGGVLSAANFAGDIYKAAKSGHVSFDDGMKIADDVTGGVSAFANVVAPGAGTAISLAEKAITGGVKIAKAEHDAYVANGRKALNFTQGLQVAEEAVLPKWMTEDVKDGAKEFKKDYIDPVLDWMDLYGDMSKEGKERRKNNKGKPKRRKRRRKGVIPKLRSMLIIRHYNDLRQSLMRTKRRTLRLHRRSRLGIIFIGNHQLHLYNQIGLSINDTLSCPLFYIPG
jgi:hypothetical protein